MARGRAKKVLHPSALLGSCPKSDPNRRNPPAVSGQEQEQDQKGQEKVKTTREIATEIIDLCWAKKATVKEIEKILEQWLWEMAQFGRN